MNVLILGSGGREHALAWRISLDREVESVFVMPGNCGMLLTDKIEIIEGNSSDLNSIKDVCSRVSPELVVIGPENLLADGIGDYIESLGIPVYGPSARAANLESSKIFAKEFMQRNGIPTAPFKVYDNYNQAVDGLLEWDLSKGVAIKADSLAGGKGVVVTDNFAEAKQTLYNFMENPDCTIRSRRVLIERRLQGKEVSAFAVCDGKDFFNLGMVCDYKRLDDGDQGPNTGGMGCYTPKDWPMSDTCKVIEDKIFSQVLKGMARDGIPFKGTLFAGLMIYDDQPSVIEFNVRFGDPETQTLMPLIEGNFTKLLKDCAEGNLVSSNIDVHLADKHGVHIVMASGGYPSNFRRPLDIGHPIAFDHHMAGNFSGDQNLFFAGVRRRGEEVVNSGGRVLGVTSLGDSLEQARGSAYQEINKISFEGAHFRNDIGDNSQEV